MIDYLKNLSATWKAIIGILPILVAGYGVGAWAGEKLNQIEKMQSDQAEVLKSNARTQEKILEFTMNLWRIDPDVQNRWARLPAEPDVNKVGDSLPGSEWYSLEGMDRLLKYHIRVEQRTRVVRDEMLIYYDTVLYVDTLFDISDPDSSLLAR